MMNILLPTDFSENSWNAIVYAVKFLEKKSCNFFLLHVSKLNGLTQGDTPVILSQEAIENTYTKPSKKQLKAFLKRITTECSPNVKHKFYTLTDYNFFIESIRKHVKDKKIDMIIMGTKGASGLKEHIIGSNAGDIITKVKCKTLVVPENAKFNALREIAFPTDYSLTYDVGLLQPLYDVVKQYLASLRILHISYMKEELNNDQKNNRELLSDFFEGLDFSFHFLTNKKVKDAIQCFVESRDIDMIVMVAKNLNYFQQILFHSKVEKISYHTNVPFLVLHE